MEIATQHTTGNIIKASKAILDRYIIFLKTNEYESFGHERFGANLGEFIDEPKTEDTLNKIRNRIINKTKAKFPEVQINKIVFKSIDNKTVQIDLKVLIVPTGESFMASFDN